MAPSNNNAFGLRWAIFGIFALSLHVPAEKLVCCGQDQPKVERIQLRFQTDHLTGITLVEAANDDLLFQTTDGQLKKIDHTEIVSRNLSDETESRLDAKSLGLQLRDELGEGFKIHHAGNFVILHNTEKEYARWIAGLYRRLENGFLKFWLRKKFKLQSKPDFPLPIILFRNRQEYRHYMSRDLGGINDEMLAYYNLKTNRVAMFDLVADQFNRDANSNLNSRSISQILNDPRAIPMVATVIHEGVHQLMFNFGMQVRLSDTPLWINEGLAMYFETPDLSANRGWRKIGIVNFLRLGQFRKSLESRDDASLQKMISSDENFRNRNALEYYAQAWAFNFFLIKKYEKEYVAYLKFMSQKKRLQFDSPDKRMNEFQKFVETDLEQLDREFVDYILKLK